MKKEDEKLGEVGMTGLLLRLFVKNYTDAENTQVRTDVGKLAGVVGIFCNGLLFFGKLVAGLLSGSVAIVADAVNNLSDASSSVVTLLGFRWHSSLRTQTIPMDTPDMNIFRG